MIESWNFLTSSLLCWRVTLCVDWTSPRWQAISWGTLFRVTLEIEDSAESAHQLWKGPGYRGPGKASFRRELWILHLLHLQRTKTGLSRLSPSVRRWSELNHLASAPVIGQLTLKTVFFTLGKTFVDTGDNMCCIVSKLLLALHMVSKGLPNLLCPKLEPGKTEYAINLYQGVLENFFCN